MTRLTQGTWVVVADGEKYLVMENQTDGEDPHLEVISQDEQDNPPAREQAANRPGRQADGGPGQKSAFDDTDWHELAKERFAHDLADRLYQKAHKGAFDRIVLVAAPNILGELRNEMHQEVADKVVGEIPKTLTNHPIREIEDIVKSDLAS